MRQIRIPKQISLTKSLAITLSAILLVSGVLYCVWAAAPSSTFWLAPGVYPGAPSFTVWREGNNYFAKNANGELASFSGSTNATTLVQNCIDALPIVSGAPSGEIRLTGSAAFSFSGFLDITQTRVQLVGSGTYATNIYWGVGASYFIYADGTPTFHFTMKHLSIYTSNDVIAAGQCLRLPNVSYCMIEDIDFVGKADVGITFLYTTNGYYNEIRHCQVSNVKYAIYGDGVYDGNVYSTPNAWNVDGFKVVNVDADGTALYLERCLVWTLSNIVLNGADGAYGIFLNGSGLMTISNLDIVDAPIPDVGVYMTGWSDKSTRSVTFLDSFMVANDAVIEIAGYTGNVTFINPHFQVGTVALNFTSVTGVTNFVLINPFNECSTFIDGKSYTAWNNGTYIAVP